MREVEEIAGVNQDAAAFEQVEHDRLLRPGRRDPRHGAPSPVGRQETDGGMAFGDPPDHCVVGPHPRRDPRGRLRPRLEQRARRGLHRRGDRQVRVGDQLQSGQRPVDRRPGTAGHHPRQLELRQADRLRETAETERQHLLRPVEHARAGSGAVQRIRAEHFVGDQRQAVLAAQRHHRVELARRHERAGRVVRVHQQDRPRARGQAAPEAAEIDLPPAVETERVRRRADRFEPGQMLEQRIARPGRHHRVAGVAQQLEQVAVRLAGARGQRHLLRRHGAAGTRQVRRDRFAGGRQAERRRPARPVFRIKQGQPRIRRRQPRPCRVRFGQVDQIGPPGPEAGGGARYPVGGEVGRYAGREHAL